MHQQSRGSRAVPGRALTGSFRVDSARASSSRQKNPANADARAGFLSFFVSLALVFLATYLYVCDIFCPSAQSLDGGMSCKKLVGM